MVRITIQDEQRRIDDVSDICDFLSQYGIWYEHWAVDGRIGADATNDEILDEYSAEINALKTRGGFVTADIINVNPATPGLDAMLAKFDREHTHNEDEVRFTVRGGGVFHIHPDGGPVFAVEVNRGDMINVPAGTRHWFTLCEDRQIQCIRLFENTSGWTPEYLDDSVHSQYQAMCFGPSDLRGEAFKSNVEMS